MLFRSILHARDKLAREELAEFVDAMSQLGYGRDEISRLLDEHISE